MNDENPSCLRIAVPLPVKGTFSYAIPESLSSSAHVGCRVMVTFNRRKITGYILEKIPRPNDMKLNEIQDLIDYEPIFNEQLVPFFEWMSNHYMYPIGQVIQTSLPGGLNRTPFKTAFLTEKGQETLDGLALSKADKKILSWIRENPGKRLPCPVQDIYKFQKQELLTIEEGIKKRQAGPLIRKFVRLRHDVDRQAVPGEKKLTLKAKNEKEFLERIFKSDTMLLSELTAEFANASYLVNKWVKNGILERYSAPVYRNIIGNVLPAPSEPLHLSSQQRRALSQIQECIDKKSFSPCLLYGVTGSGKTEVYCRAVEESIRSGRQALMLVPEISLSVYMEGIFRARLGGRIAGYHSGLSEGERYDQWMRMIRGEVDLVIGARSALFAPLPRLGLIIVDEEHDSSYKQEGSLRYQARDTAVVRAKMEKIPIILGSGTPSVQSYHNSLRKKYKLLTMAHRVEKRPLPDVEVVDMKSRQKDEMISGKLKKALEHNLAAGNQTLLFLNRRGFHRLYLCRYCGKTIRCPNCDVALTYHLEDNRLSCHYCGYYSNILLKCSTCGGKGLKAYGFGTEKLELEIKSLFPAARVARMDTDSTRKKGQALQILKRFGNHEIDILVGTQMITKGFDFPDVTLVGVIAADLSLGFPDFRAGERTFQILSQVTGRAGRGTLKGRAIIQTFNPEHYSIHTAMTHDYDLFFEKEKELREQLSYPPFSHLACLRFSGSEKIKTEKMVRQMGLAVKSILASRPKGEQGMQVLGPVEAPISRIKGKYRWHILIKSKKFSMLQFLLKEVEKRSKKILSSSDVLLILDVDPYQML